MIIKKLINLMKKRSKDRDEIEKLKVEKDSLTNLLKSTNEVSELYKKLYKDYSNKYYNSTIEERLMDIANIVADNLPHGRSNYTIQHKDENTIEIHAIGVSENESWIDGGVVKTISIF